MTIGMRSNPPLRLTGLVSNSAPELGTLFLAGLSTASLALVRIESTWNPSIVVIQTAVWLAGPLLVGRTLFRSERWRAGIDRWHPLLIGLWPLLPGLTDVVLRHMGLGEAFEIVMLCCAGNAALMLSAFAHRRRCQQIAGLLGSFVVLFALVISAKPPVVIVSGLYGVASLWWLMARYWERVQRARPAAAVESCRPLRGSILAATLAAIVAVAALVGFSSRETYVLGGFMPSSGGSKTYDPAARAGVGDGDDLVAARDQALSFGPVESELFLESEMPSLYDMFNETYGEPLKPKSELSVALSSADVRETPQQMAVSRKSGREFSNVRRRRPAPQQSLADRDGPAMLYVVGRTPLHLGLETYDSFDGAKWHQSPYDERQSPIRLELLDGKPWMWVQRPGTSPLHRGSQTHAIKVINLKSCRIPSPPQLAAVHVDRVDRESFYGWTEDGMLEMPHREHIPQLTVLHERSLQLNLEPLRESDFTERLPRPRSLASDRDDTAIDVLARCVERHLRTGEVDEQVAATGRSWTTGVSRGWRQVEAVVERLRSDFHHDPNEPAAPDCHDVVSHFLRRGRGPDYQFATTAAIVLRTLGYPTRLVTGFYARPERFDRRAGQTSVLKQDVHVWAEVCVDGRTWVAIEPTPGFSPPVEALTWGQRAAMVANSWATWCAHHRLSLAILGALAAALWLSRIVWCEAMLFVVCWLAGLGGLSRRVLWTLRLLECRARLAGNPRPADKTVSTWYAPAGHLLSADAARELRSFLSLTERMLYGGRGHALDESAHRRACGAVLGKLHVRQLRQLRA